MHTDRMDLVADARLTFPRHVVFAAYRDKLTDLVDYLPNVRKIEVKERRDEGPVVHLLNVWHGGGEIPPAARAFLSESMLSWTDHARWDEGEWACEWRIETHAFTEAVVCRGKNRFKADGDNTLFELRGSLEIDGTKVKGVPRLLASKVGKAVEEVLVGKIKPNLIDVSNGLQRYLEAEKKAGRL